MRLFYKWEHTLLLEKQWPIESFLGISSEKQKKDSIFQF